MLGWRRLHVLTHAVTFSFKPLGVLHPLAVHTVAYCRPEYPKHGRLSSSRANWHNQFVLYEIIPNLLLFFFTPPVIILQAEWSHSAVLKSNLQTPTWLLLISHRLFITAITSPHIFILLLLHCCWPAPPPPLNPPSSLSPTDWPHLSPSILTPSFDLQPPVQPIPRSFPRTFPQFIHYFLPPGSLFFHLHLWMHLSCSRLSFYFPLARCHHNSAACIWAKQLSSVFSQPV